MVEEYTLSTHDLVGICVFFHNNKINIIVNILIYIEDSRSLVQKEHTITFNYSK